MCHYHVAPVLALPLLYPTPTNRNVLQMRGRVYTPRAHTRAAHAHANVLDLKPGARCTALALQYTQRGDQTHDNAPLVPSWLGMIHKTSCAPANTTANRVSVPPPPLLLLLLQAQRLNHFCDTVRADTGTLCLRPSANPNPNPHVHTPEHTLQLQRHSLGTHRRDRRVHRMHATHTAGVPIP